MPEDPSAQAFLLAKWQTACWPSLSGHSPAMDDNASPPRPNEIISIPYLSYREYLMNLTYSKTQIIKPDRTQSVPNAGHAHHPSSILGFQNFRHNQIGEQEMRYMVSPELALQPFGSGRVRGRHDARIENQDIDGLLWVS